MSIKKEILVRVRIVFLCVLLFAVAVIIRTGYVQLVQGDKWRKMAQEITIRPMVVKATRGNIYSDNGSLLATSLPFYKVTMDPTRPTQELFNSKIDSLSILFSRFYGDRSAKEYERRIRNARALGKQYFIVNHEMIGYQDKKRIEKWPLVREGRLKGGVIFEKTEKRFKPFDHMAFRTIGFMNDNKAGAGLEISFNSRLAGRDGEALFTRIAGNSWKPLHDESEIRPEEGLDIQTTLDVNLQDVAEDALYRHLVAHDAEYGSVVVMEVATGEIKAMANLGKAGEGRYLEKYNYAVGNQGMTDPGSTFKLATMMALMEEENIEIDDTINTGTGKYKFYDRTMTDSKPEGYGNLSLIDVFAKSSNIGVSKLTVEKFGNKPQKYRDYIHKFGLDLPLDFQMKGTAIPYIKSPKDSTWSGVTLPWMSIGYEMNVSPLQMLTFYNAVANNGKMVQPMIVKSVWRADKLVDEFPVRVMNEKICSDETLNKVKLMLEAVTDHGTAHNIKNPNYKIAGKTGTAQKIKAGAYTKKYYTSFIGYFPAEKPKYSCVVVIDSPNGFLQYGSDVAAPVFKEIADKIYAKDPEMFKPLNKQESLAEMGVFPEIRAGYHEDLRFLCNTLKISNHATAGDEEWVSSRSVNNAVMFQNRRIVEGLVPDVNGMTLKDAFYILENAGLRVRYEGKGRVMSQSIMPGGRAMKGSTIFVRLG